MTKWQNDVMNLLQEYLQEHFGEVEQVEQAGTTFLRLTPALFVDGTGLVYMEICMLDYSEDVQVVQIYSTMIPEPEPGLSALREKLGEWNFHSLIGAYGIYEKLGQLYHKHNVALFNDGAVDDQVEFLFAGICTAMDEMARRLPDAAEISAG